MSRGHVKPHGQADSFFPLLFVLRFKVNDPDLYSVIETVFHSLSENMLLLLFSWMKLIP